MPGSGRLLAQVVTLVATGILWSFVEVITLGKELDPSGPSLCRSTSTGPARATAYGDGRRQARALRGLALGFRNLTNYIARSLLEAGGFSLSSHALDCAEPHTGSKFEPGPGRPVLRRDAGLGTCYAGGSRLATLPRASQMLAEARPGVVNRRPS